MIGFDPGTVDTAMQSFIRAKGMPVMLPADYAIFAGFHEQRQLRPPDDAGRVLAHVALRSPRDWSGTVVTWDDARVCSLIAG